jgi:hypothetical protein
MVLQIYANKYIGDPDFLAACQAENVNPQPASEWLTAKGEPWYNGIAAWCNDLANTADGASAADVKAAWPELAAFTDDQVEALMRYIASKTTAVVFDPGP